MKEYLLSIFILFILILFLPFLSKRVEKNIEVFFFLMGSLSILFLILFRGEYPSYKFFITCLKEPFLISFACLIAGFFFYRFQKKITAWVFVLEKNLFFPFLFIVILGIISSAITAIIASLILVEIISGLSIRRKEKIALCVISCLSIGLGASLTPIGEPLSTIAISKLKYPPYNADFFFLFRLLSPYIIPPIIILGILGIWVYRKGRIEKDLEEKEQRGEKEIKMVFIRGGKVYLFVLSLLLLGEGFKPFIELYISKISPSFLYIFNISSAILDNATLTACEISPKMSIFHIKVALLSLLLSGGMLIPGNIPNIISAEKLEIGMREWARVGVPLSGIFLIAFYFILF